MLFVVGEYMNPVTEVELSDLANYIPPNAQERIALILGMEGETVENLRGEHRDNIHGISLGILRKWKNAHHQKGNKVVSFIIFSLSYMISQNNLCQSWGKYRITHLTCVDIILINKRPEGDQIYIILTILTTCKDLYQKNRISISPAFWHAIADFHPFWRLYSISGQLLPE